MNKFLKLFFGLDLWIALSLMTTMMVDMIFSSRNAAMIACSIGLAIINVITCLVVINSINFYKNKTVKTTN